MHDPFEYDDDVEERGFTPFETVALIVAILVIVGLMAFAIAEMSGVL